MPLIDVVIGTRPEAIKMAPVIRHLEESEELDCRVFLTGQHRDPVINALAEFGVREFIKLPAMPSERGVIDIASHTMQYLGAEWKLCEPDLVLVHGDTTSALGGAMAAFMNKIPVGHVEAGLRSHNFREPFPEEMNRVLIDRLASFHFVPTELEEENLEKEGISTSGTLVSGNTVIDALAYASNAVGPVSPARKHVLVTMHRRELFESGASTDVIGAIVDLANKHQGVNFVWVAHPNPKNKEIVAGAVDGIDNIELVEPCGYLDFVRLMKKSRLIISDSGGVQEEAPALGVPLIVARDVTERKVGLDAGNFIVGTVKREKLFAAADAEITTPSFAPRDPFVYGDGFAAEYIVEALEGFDW